MPLADPIVDLCIECGFCEPACPSHQLTLSPRQRIVDDARDGAAAADAARTMRGSRAMEESFGYAGLYTCAAGNVCAGRCPVGIETGTMVLGERARRQSDANRRTAETAATAHAGDRARPEVRHRRAGAEPARSSATARPTRLRAWLRKVARTPRVSRALRPGPGAPTARHGATGGTIRRPPASRCRSRRSRTIAWCISRPARRACSAPTRREYDLLPAPQAMIALLERAGFEVIVPDGLDGQCCGQPFLSKGFPEEAQAVGSRLVGEAGAGRARAS